MELLFMFEGRGPQQDVCQGCLLCCRVMWVFRPLKWLYMLKEPNIGGVSDLEVLIKTKSFVRCSLCGENCVTNINLVEVWLLEGGV